ncbi:MAG TPA: response regulator transcription factor [Polyangiaceae bacterium]|nr:response regulator transcription factor [Polyangiaceae bacterium]
MSGLALRGFGASSAPSPAVPAVPVAFSARVMDLNVLIVDDDERLYELLAQYLAENGVIAKRAATGPLGLKAIESGESYDAVLLDIMLPGLDGLSLLKRVREKSQIPVIMLTAKGDETDRVVGLELGADDYLAKPFSPRELLARLRAVLRRTQVDPNKEQLAVGSLAFDVAARSVQRDGRNIELTGLEFDLLLALARRAGRVVPRSNLLELAGRNDVNVSDRTVDVHVSHIRKKLGDDDALLLKTVRGVGYVLTRE